MPYDSLRENEKRWQRKRLFRKRHPASRLITSLLCVALVLLLAGWWLELLPLFLPTEKPLP